MVLEQKTAWKQEHPIDCCHRTIPTGSASSLMTTAWWPMPGLLLPATLARHLGLRELVDRHLDLGGAPGRANTGDKLLTLVASALTGGDCIDDADALRTGGTARTLGGVVKASSTLGTFLRSFRWGHVRQLDRVSRELLARAWAAGAGPGDAPFTIDLDSTICETYGLDKEGARPPWLHRQARLSPAAGRRRRHRRRADGPAARGPRQHPPAAPPTSCGRRWGGCATLAPAGSSPCGPTAASTLIAWYPPAAGWMSASPSPSASTKACIISSRPYPKMPGRRFPTGWTALPMSPRLLTLPSRVSPTPHPVRLIIRRVKPAHSSQFPAGPLRQLQLSRLHHRPGRRDPGTGGRSSPPRRDRERDTRPQVRRRAEPHAVRPFAPPTALGWRYR